MSSAVKNNGRNGADSIERKEEVPLLTIGSAKTKMTADSFTLSADRAKSGETAVHVSDDERKHQIFSCMGLSAFDKICAIIAEVIGTGLLVLIGCLSVCTFPANAANPLLSIALAFGFAIMIGAQTVGHISGGHFNPAVTVAAIIYRCIEIPIACAYIVAQLVGGALGYGVLKLVMTDKMQSGPDGVCVTHVNDDLQMYQGFIVEFVATGILVWVICGIWDPRNAKKTDSTPLRAGLTVATLVMVAGPFTGGSLNPARSFGPALWTGDWEDNWVYWVAPTLGGAVFSLIYKSLFWRSPSDLDD